MLDRLGHFVVRRARAVLVAAFIAVIAAAALGLGAFGRLQTGGFQAPDAQSTKAQALIDARYGGQPNLVFLARARHGSVDDPAVRSIGTRLTERLSREPIASDVHSYWTTNSPALRSAGGTSALVLAHVPDRKAGPLVDKYAVSNSTVSIKAGGEQGFNHDGQKQVQRSLATAEMVAVPLILVLLVFVFGSVVAALLPLAIGGIAIVGTFAELFVMGSLTHVSIYAVNLTTALGLGLGIDYALLTVSRFRERLAAGESVPAAVVGTVRTAGRTILFSAAAVAAALAALLVFPMYFLRSFAYAGIGVVVIAAIAALLVTPALLAVLGARVNAGRLPWSKAVRGADAPIWGRIAGAVMRRPAVTAIPVLAVLLMLASPLLGITFGTPDDRVLRHDVASRQVGDALRTEFPGNDSSAIDVVATGTVRPADLSTYTARISRLPGVSHVDIRGDGLLSVSTKLDETSGAAQRLAHDIRAVPAPNGVEMLVGGPTAQLVDTKSTIAARLPITIALVALTTFIVLFLFTGSIVQPVRALLSSALSLSATLGVVVWIFQQGHLSSLLGFTPRPIDTSMTVLLFCIAFGLSMDYEVFVISRIKEIHDTGVDVRDSVRAGLARTGRIVSTAAGLLAVSFFAFGTSSVSFLQLFGIGSGLAVLIDATLIRGVLVPALMRVFGAASWYAPAPLRRVHARLALTEG